MKLRVKPHIQIPHELRHAEPGSAEPITYVFSPDCEQDVPDKYAESQIETGNFEKAVGKVDMSKYKVKDKYVNETIFTVIAKLSETDKMKLFEISKKMLSDTNKEKQKGDADAKSTPASNA